ncbi:hypothetical protein O0880_14245 [Janthinobacterium sp. SUN118]|uniref:hypothetical protein n=1 Tax=Janthinobacterium sp. SUN118 TaxID=3004100 RepID=UPI0025B1FCAB|nr:hypothetical protein [Janthinobacterium sp. SUN118]MDN2710583.1 hypothetical protein [Janthinobacterium sp. SUN118]
MVYDNPTIHNGFTITAFACELPEGCWQGQLILRKCGFEDVAEPNLQNRATEREAVQSALAMGWQIANYATPDRILNDK